VQIVALGHMTPLLQGLKPVHDQLPLTFGNVSARVVSREHSYVGMYRAQGVFIDTGRSLERYTVIQLEQ
jgi:hypothetical protein